MLPCNLETDEGLGRNVGLGRQDGILLEWGLAEYLILLRLGIDPSITQNCFSMSSNFGLMSPLGDFWVWP